jgi:formamidopyrimidine-DNA glycosylase
MPELPEVETIRAGLQELLPDKKVTAVWHDWEKSFPNAAADVKAFLIGAVVQGVRRRAKVLLIDLDSEYTLVIHLKMTGQMVYVKKNLPSGFSGEQHVDAGLSNGPKRTYSTEMGVTEVLNRQATTSHSEQATGSLAGNGDEIRWGAGHPNDSLINDLPDKSTRVIFDLQDVRGPTSHKERLFFNDQRKFGWVRLMPTVEVPNIDFMQKVGPEPLSNDFTPQMFAGRIRRRANTNIKAALLDQTVVAGIGNIYADESLWGSRIHPSTLVKHVSTRKLNKLYGEIRRVLQLSIDQGGSSDKNYVNAEGKKGSYLEFANVFRREGLACPRCATELQKIRVAGRGTHICPRCQKVPKKAP